VPGKTSSQTEIGTIIPQYLGEADLSRFTSKTSCWIKVCAYVCHTCLWVPPHVETIFTIKLARLSLPLYNVSFYIAHILEVFTHSLMTGTWPAHRELYNTCALIMLMLLRYTVTNLIQTASNRQPTASYSTHRGAHKHN